MKRKPRFQRKVGDIVAIPLGEDRVAFGWVLEEPLIAFFDCSSDIKHVPSVQQLVQTPIAFRIWVMNRALAAGTWAVLGHAQVPDELAIPPLFLKQDRFSGKVTVTRTGAEEEAVPKEKEKWITLERAAVWDPDHVVDRLRDHFEGRPNKWVEAMRVRL
jgi:hypothetical protein